MHETVTNTFMQTGTSRLAATSETDLQGQKNVETLKTPLVHCLELNMFFKVEMFSTSVSKKGPIISSSLKTLGYLNRNLIAFSLSFSQHIIFTCFQFASLLDILVNAIIYFLKGITPQSYKCCRPTLIHLSPAAS